MKECVKEVLKSGKVCECQSCPLWIKYPEEMNCTMITVEVNGEMSLQEISKRVGIYRTTCSKILKGAMKKMAKNLGSENM
jgi:predicted transcriptional regulator